MFIGVYELLIVLGTLLLPIAFLAILYFVIRAAVRSGNRKR